MVTSLRIAFVEWPEGLSTNDAPWLKLRDSVTAARPDLPVTNELPFGPWLADTVFEEIRKTVHGYNLPAPIILSGAAAQANPVNGPIPVPPRPDPIRSSHDNLFTSGNLGRYSKVLHQVLEGRR